MQTHRQLEKSSLKKTGFVCLFWWALLLKIQLILLHGEEQLYETCSICTIKHCSHSALGNGEKFSDFGEKLE